MPTLLLLTRHQLVRPANDFMITTLEEISKRLHTQDNRITQNPMFCVQIKRRDVGYDSSYSDNKCWRDSANELTVYDDDKEHTNTDGDEWGEFGYVDRWETVMVSFTEKGCEEYLELNGHNDKARAYNGDVRIYVESFNRCQEMIAIREYLLSLTSQASRPVVGPEASSGRP